MAPDPESESKQSTDIEICCPSCETCFRGQEELRGVLVECGECGHQFEVPSSNVARGSHTKPNKHPERDESRDSFLKRIPKVNTPLPSVTDKHVPESFASHTKAEFREPATPLQVMMGAIAVFILIVAAIFLIIGSRRGAVLDGVGFDKQLLLAGFSSLMATGMLIYSNRRFWYVAVLAGGGLIALPFILQGLPQPGGDPAPSEETSQPVDVDEGAQEMTQDELRYWIGTEPLENERNRFLDEGSSKDAFGLWMLNIESQYVPMVREYIIRVMGASLDTHDFERENGNCLLVVTGTSRDLDALSEAAQALGEVNAVYRELGVVEVEVINKNFRPQPLDKLTNEEHSDFYLANALDLRSIDVDRIVEALRRLSVVEPVLLRNDISERMIELLESAWFEYKDEVCRALLVWAKPDGQAGQVALQQARKMHDSGKEVPTAMVDLCLEQGVLEILPVIYELWREDPVAWEPFFKKAGAPAEAVLLRGYTDTKGVLRQSASKLLGEVGGESSLQILRNTSVVSPDPETRAICKQSIEMIQKRLKP